MSMQHVTGIILLLCF